MEKGGDKGVLSNRTNAPVVQLGTDKKTDGKEENTAKFRYFKVLFTKYAPHKKRKNKSFEDGFVVVGGRPGGPSGGGKYSNKVILLDEDSKEKASVGLSKVAKVLWGVLEQFDRGDDVESFTVGGYDVELDVEVNEGDFQSGAMFMESRVEVKVDKVSLANRHGGKMLRPYEAFARPLPSNNGGALHAKGTLPAPKRVLKPMFNPRGPESIVLNKDCWEADQDGVCPVVLDPALVKCMRAHQKVGVQFMYKCMTERVKMHRGCILADDMGLGKSLQAISLLHTMLKQGPQGMPMVQRALIVAPSSLLENWKQEIKKWLGDEKLKSIILGVGAQKDQAKQTVIDFKFGKVFKVGIISYETLRKYSSDLSGFVDIVVADEGHRLKSVSGNKTIDALQALGAGRKILLSGTPLQNNLSELFAMVDFVRPGSLGSISSFQHVFAGPIEKGREKNASEEAVNLGKARVAELQRILGDFILRRDASVNRAYLPNLSSYAVFCKPTDLQVSMIKDIISRRWKSDLYVVKDDILALLSELRKVCGHPSLLVTSPQDDQTKSDTALESERISGQSGKLIVLCALLDRIVHHMGERCVIVSQWTSMLDIIETCVKDMGLIFCRLDGSTSISKRQDIVNAFNKNNIGQVFLLSTAAGGAGLNLIGANRLILVDSHWNPAFDNQAMARIWRDGQKKDCSVYRLVTTGTVEEKVYQRQMLKGELAACVNHPGIDQKQSKGTSKDKEWGSFTKEEIKELFDLHVGTSCMTADQLGNAYQDDIESSDSLLLSLRSQSSSVPITFVYKEKVQMMEQAPEEAMQQNTSKLDSTHASPHDDLETCDDF